jgi:predicted unusual protein kinase regulating ubiquinone biosynthesis (AarF/ABC1/UbiB family)
VAKAKNKTNNEDDRLSGRVKRYAQVGAAAGELAARFVGGRILGLELNKSEHAAELRAALGGLKGPLMKTAQILATVPDVLPPEYMTELAQLQANAPPMGWAFVRRRMAGELGNNWREKLQDFEHESASAASLGQVHKATALDGRKLACKLQYPDMASAVEADLKQLKFVFSIFRRYDKAINPSNIHDELSERLREELDYVRESQNMRLYQEMLADEPGVHVPEPISELSTNRLLTMTWLEGARLLDVVDRPLKKRNAIALNMFRAWYVPFYEFGVIHGDPHLGNYTVCPDGKINLLDFGCIRIFRPSFVRAVIDLYWALERDDTALAVHAYETWGFQNLSREMIGVLNQWARFLYGPLLKDRVRPIQEEPSGIYGAEVASKVHQEIRNLGGVTPPRELVLMDRAAIGLGSVFMHLKAEINWHQMFHDLVADFDEKTLDKRQKRILKSAGIAQAA